MIMPWVRIAAVTELTPGTLLPYDLGGTEIVVCNSEGAIHAFQGLCPHRNGPLAQGNLADGCIICPWHAWEFDCRTGEYDYNPGIRLRKHEVRVDGNDVLVELP